MAVPFDTATRGLFDDFVTGTGLGWTLFNAVGSGTVTNVANASFGAVRITTGITGGHSTGISAGGLLPTPINFTSVDEFSWIAAITSAGPGDNGLIMIADSGSPSYIDAVGWMITTTTAVPFCSNGGGQTTGPAFIIAGPLRAVNTGASWQFYNNGILVHTISTNLPGGSGAPIAQVSKGATSGVGATLDVDHFSVLFVEGESGISLDQLQDVVLTAPSSGQFLSFNGTNWINTVAPTPAEPANQIVYGTGAGIDSSPNFTFDPINGALSLFGNFAVSPGTGVLLVAADSFGMNGAYAVLRAGLTSGSGFTGGDLYLAGGDGFGTPNSAEGGSVFITSGQSAFGTGNSGDVNIATGTAGGSGSPGDVNITGGTNGVGTNAGSINITSGATFVGTAGITTLAGGNSSGPGAAGIVNINGGTSLSGAGGDINITAGSGGGTDGIVTITGGNGDTLEVGASIALSTTGLPRLTILSTGEWLVEGASGTAGQAIVSGGPGVAPSWSSVSPALYDANPVAATPPNASGNNAVAIGSGAINQADDAVVWGTGASAGQFGTATNSVVIGPNSQSNATFGITIGTGSGSNQFGAIAIGIAATSNGIEAITIGSSANAQGTNIIAIGKSANGTGTGEANSIAIGVSTIIDGPSAIAIGAGAVADGIQSPLAIGNSANASGQFSVALGPSAETGVTAGDSIAIGTLAISNESQAITMGYTVTNAQPRTFFTGTGAATARIAEFGSAVERQLTTGAAGGDFASHEAVVQMRLRTTSATPSELRTFDSARLTISASRVWHFDAVVIGQGQTVANNDYAVYKFTDGVLFRDNANNTTLLVAPTKTVLAESDATTDANITADNTNEALAITVTGVAAENWVWLGYVTLKSVIPNAT